MKLSPQALLDEWEGEEDEPTGMNPQRIQYLRAEFMAYTDRPIPHSISQIESYVDKMRGPMTQDLREEVDRREKESEQEDDTE